MRESEVGNSELQRMGEGYKGEIKNTERETENIKALLAEITKET